MVQRLYTKSMIQCSLLVVELDLLIQEFAQI